MRRGKFFLYVGWILCVLQSVARNPPVVTNVWVKSTGGNWSESAAWSTGLVPSATHWVAVTNAGPKTIEINSSTAQNYPGSLAVLDLLVANTNTVFLNNVGATLHVNYGTNTWNGLQLNSGGTLIDSNSDIQVVNGGLVVEGGHLFQSGGTVESGGMGIYGGGVYRLTNGVLKVGNVRMDAGGAFEQFGGRVETQSPVILGGFAYYRLVDGELDHTGDDFVVGGYSTFTQEGGTFRTKSLTVAAQGSNAAFFMDGGELYAGNLDVWAGMSEGIFEQNGGIIVVTNGLSLFGSARHYPWNGVPAQYTVGSNAVLSAGSLACDQNFGVCEFTTLGRASFSGNIEFNGGADFIGHITISDGALSCSNLLSDGTILNISQTGGALVVSNVFSISGYYPGREHGDNAGPAIYDFQGGTLFANRIELTAEWRIGSSTRAARISNPGEILLLGTLRVGDADENLGRAILSGDSMIDLRDGNAKINFAASSQQAWTTSALLIITNWNGSASGGGNDQVRFGSSASGLTAQQLSQIRFVNPNGFPGGEYAAGILDSGEIVPVVPAQLSASASGGSLVLNWPTGGVLQYAEQVEGPYTDMPSASPPYAVDVTAKGQLFLRLRP